MTVLFAIIFSFVFGLCVGSFLNVCIYRLPAGLSIAYPGSRCPNCERPIRFYDNIPLVSWLILRGRCRYCQGAIAGRYPVVELLTGLFALACYLRFDLWPERAVYFLFIAALILITFIDLDHQIIPDVITLPGIAVGLGATLFLPRIGLVDGLLGVLAGGGSLYAVAWLYHFFTGKEGMGGGDIKLLAMMGALIGWPGVVFTIFVSSAVGTLAGVTVLVAGARRGQGLKLRVPFGPFLSIGAIAYLFAGPELIQWYLDLMRVG